MDTNVNKSVNKGWGAYTNQKNENQVLKAQLVLHEANQNGIRLTIDEKGEFKNIDADCTPFRIPKIEIKDVNITKTTDDDADDSMLSKAEKDIEKEIRALQEQLAFSKEIKKKKEVFKETQNKKIEILKEEIVAKTLQYNMEMNDLLQQIQDLENMKNISIDKIMEEIDDTTITNEINNEKTIRPKAKARAIVRRKPLYEVIKQPTKFKTVIKGLEFISYTEDGHKIICKNSNKHFGSLNEWLEHSIVSVLRVNTTKKSVYEVVQYYNNTKKEWRALKTDYLSDTTILN